MRKPGGHFNLVSQFQGKHCLYTFLEDYKKDPENATPYMVLTVYDELLTKKQISLLRGDLISGHLSYLDAQRLLALTKRFYLDSAEFKWVEDFNRRPRDFHFDAYLKHCP